MISLFCRPAPALDLPIADERNPPTMASVFSDDSAASEDPVIIEKLSQGYVRTPQHRSFWARLLRRRSMASPAGHSLNGLKGQTLNEKPVYEHVVKMISLTPGTKGSTLLKGELICTTEQALAYDCWKQTIKSTRSGKLELVIMHLKPNGRNTYLCNGDGFYSIPKKFYEWVALHTPPGTDSFDFYMYDDSFLTTSKIDAADTRSLPDYFRFDCFALTSWQLAATETQARDSGGKVISFDQFNCEPGEVKIITQKHQAGRARTAVCVFTQF